MADVTDRDSKERRLARKLSRILRSQMGQLLELMGDPPEIGNVSQEFWDDAGEELRRVLGPFSEETYLEQAQMLLEGIPIGVDWALVNESAVRWARDYSFELVTGVNSTSERVLRQSVSSYYEQGLTIGDLESKLSGTFGPTRAEMIAVTEVTRASAFGEYDLASVLQKETGVEMIAIWQTNRDEIVCPICRPLNGLEAVSKDVLGRPFWEHPETNERYQHPAHPRCRCWASHELPRVTEIDDELAYPEEFYDLPQSVQNRIYQTQWNPNNWENEKPWLASLEDVKKGEIPGINYNPDARYVARNNTDGTISLGPGFFKNRNPDLPDTALFYHEAGHTVGDVVQNTREDWLDLLEPFRIDKDKPRSVRSWYDNPFGLSTRPEEMLADAYADIIVVGSQYESSEYLNLVNMIRETARIIGFPTEKITP